jgi:two-component system, OmpR family, sensor kinase
VSESQNAPWYSPVLSLRWQLAFVYSGLFGIFVVILSIFLYTSTSDLLLNNAKAALPQHARDLRTLLIQDMCTLTPAQTPGKFVQANMGTDIDDIYLLNRHGLVLASNNNRQLNQIFPYIKASYFSSPASQMPQSFQGQTSAGKTGDGQILPVQVPTDCAASALLPAYIAVITSYSSERQTLQTILFTLGVVSIIMIVAGALVISFFTGVMLSPLKQMTNATRALARGDLQQRVLLVQNRNEIGILGTSFNQMADRIEQMFTAQQASEHRSRRFVSDASHELRTPLTSLRGFTEVLIRGAKDDPETAQHILGLMKNEAERMTNLVNDLLTLARLDEGHIPPAADLDPVDVAIECLQQIRKQTPENCKISLELATQERLTIHANREPIAQMLQILLANAIKYGCAGEQKKILLRLDKKARHTLIQVIDQGNGIAPDDLPHIFDRFYRGENAHSSANLLVQGTGLGLSIAQAIAQAYQGTITVCSAPGEGTTLTVSFPYKP